MPRGRKRTATAPALGDPEPPVKSRRSRRAAESSGAGGQLSGTKALMLAVLEEGIRSYLGDSAAQASEAELWIQSPQGRSPFSFSVVCEILGLDPDAVRSNLRRMKNGTIPARKSLRARNNVRTLGRVHARKTT